MSGLRQIVGGVTPRARALATSVRRRRFWPGAERDLLTAPGRSDAVSRLYQTALGRLPEETALLAATARLAAGMSLRRLAAEVVASEEFQKRHGPGQAVDEPFLTALYRDALGRAPDPQGLAAWLRAGRKGLSRARAAVAFSSSHECRRRFPGISGVDRRPEASVRSLYRAALGRLPESEALKNASRLLQEGRRLQVLAENIVKSPEFQARHGTTRRVDQAFVEAVYRDALGRAPDPEGLRGWLRFARRGGTRGRFLAAFAQAPECLAHAMELGPGTIPASTQGNPHFVVSCLYKTALGRFADEAGYRNGVASLASGGSVLGLAESLVASAEFQFRHGANGTVTPKYLRALYRDGLGREPDLDSLFAFLRAGTGGATRAQVLAEVGTSEEAKRHCFPETVDPVSRYRAWVAANDRLGDSDREMIRLHLSGFATTPCFGVIVPAGNDVGALRRTVRSVVDQLYPHWELWVVLSPLGGDPLGEWLGDGASDPRIRALTTADAAAQGTLDAVLNRSSAEYFGLLAPGDLLAGHALYQAAFALDESPADVLYTDHDHLDAQGERCEPWFKPGFDPDWLLGQDYLNPFVLYRTEFLRGMDGKPAALEGTASFELALRATASAAPDRICHVPAILYHRAHLPADNLVADIDANLGMRKAVRDFLNQQGFGRAEVVPLPHAPWLNRVVWPLPDPAPTVSVIIPTRDRLNLLRPCVTDLLERTTYPNLEVLVVDNDSREPETLAFLAELPARDERVRVIRQVGAFNYSALNNAAARLAQGEVLVLLNNDIRVIDGGWLRELVSQVCRADVGIAGAKLLYADGRVQHGGVVCGPDGVMIHLQRDLYRNDAGYLNQLQLTRTLLAVTGACLAVRKDLFLQVGGLDEVNLRVAYNDIDLCLRIGDLGYRVVWTPFAELLHLESVSRGKDDTPEKKALFRRESGYMRRTWLSILEDGDPFHNPNVLFGWDRSEIPSAPRRSQPWCCTAMEFAKLGRFFVDAARDGRVDQN